MRPHPPKCSLFVREVRAPFPLQPLLVSPWEGNSVLQEISTGEEAWGRLFGCPAHPGGRWPRGCPVCHHGVVLGDTSAQAVESQQQQRAGTAWLLQQLSPVQGPLNFRSFLNSGKIWSPPLRKKTLRSDQMGAVILPSCPGSGLGTQGQREREREKSACQMGRTW
jgi:hypothetical protein